MNGNRTKCLLALAILFGYVPNLVQLFYPFCLDHPLLALMGRGLVKGDLPYVAFVDHAFPGSILLYSFASLFGQDPFWYRLLDWVWQLGAGMLMFWLASRLSSPFTGFAVMVCYGTLYSFAGAGSAGARDPMVTLPYLLSILLLVLSQNSRHRKPLVFLVGIISSLVFLIKPTHCFWILFVGLWLLWRHRSFLAPAIYGIGFVAPIVAYGLPYFARSRLTELFECTILFNLMYSEASPVPTPGFVRDPAIYLVLITLFLSWFLFHNEKRLVSLVVLWIFSAVLGYLVQGKYFANHLLPAQAAVAFLVVTSACALSGRVIGKIRKLELPSKNNVSIWKRDIETILRNLIFRTNRVPRIIGQAVLVAMVAILALWPRFNDNQLNDWNVAYQYLRGQINKEQMDKFFGGMDDVDASQVARFIKLVSTPKDRVACFGAGEARLLTLAERKPASRLFMARFLFPFKESDSRPLWKKWRDEFSADLLGQRPKVITFRRGSCLSVEGRQEEVKEAIKETFPDVWKMIEHEYASVKRIGAYEVYERVSSYASAQF